eukprot:5738036-Amphidinium_carterae.1
MSKSVMTITPVQLTQLIEHNSHSGGLSCFREVAKDESEHMTEVKLLPFLIAVAGKTQKVSPQCFAKAIQGCEASSAEKDAMTKVFFP